MQRSRGEEARPTATFPGRCGGFACTPSGGGEARETEAGFVGRWQIGFPPCRQRKATRRTKGFPCANLIATKKSKKLKNMSASPII